MNYCGKLLLNEKNEFGVFDSNKGEYAYLSKELDNYRDKKIHIVITNDSNDVIFNEKGNLSSRKVIGNGLYDIYIGKGVNSEKNESSNDLSIGVNLTDFLFNRVGDKIRVTIKELTQDESEVIK